MSGPPYPKGAAGAPIGSFIIGVTPFGDATWFDPWWTIISQYANSDRITSLIEDFAAYSDFTLLYDDFFEFMCNVYTAQGYGLDCIGKIVGVGRVLDIATAGPFFGFDEASPTVAPFNQAPFYNGGSLTTSFSLTDDAYRILILAKMAANVTDGSITSLNTILMNLFPNRGDAFVTDDGTMRMSYTFNFPLTAVEKAIVTQSGVLPQPAGVHVSYVQNF